MRKRELAKLARALRRDVEANLNDRRGLHWDSIPAESGKHVLDALRADVEKRFLAILRRHFPSTPAEQASVKETKDP